MIIVQKFQLPLGDTGTITAPPGLTPLHVGLDPKGVACLWASVENMEPAREVVVHSIGTGWTVPTGARYAGTVLAANRVWHIYLDLPPAS